VGKLITNYVIFPVKIVAGSYLSVFKT